MARAVVADQPGATAPKSRKRRNESQPAETIAQETAEVEEPPVSGRQRKQLSGSHLEALEAGRQEARAVRRYLEAMTNRPHGNSRHRDPEFLQRKLKRLEDAIPNERDALTRLGYIQQRLTTIHELEALSDTPEDFEELEEHFIKAAKRYGERKGITYPAWRAAGVAADVLRRAGISRTNG